MPIKEGKMTPKTWYFQTDFDVFLTFSSLLYVNFDLQGLLIWRPTTANALDKGPIGPCLQGGWEPRLDPLWGSILADFVKFDKFYWFSSKKWPQKSIFGPKFKNSPGVPREIEKMAFFKAVLLSIFSIFFRKLWNFDPPGPFLAIFDDFDRFWPYFCSILTIFPLKPIGNRYLTADNGTRPRYCRYLTANNSWAPRYVCILF